MKMTLSSATALVALSASAFAADLPSRAAPTAAPVPVFTWTGFYAGGSIGGVNLRSKYDELTGYGTSGGFPLTRGKGNGILASVDAGYNYQVGNIVFGLEGDIGLSTARANGSLVNRFPTYIETNYLHARLSALATLRGRVGFAYDRVLVYATGGLAVAKLRLEGDHEAPVSIDPNVTNGIAAVNGWRAGWVVGGGAEYALTSKVSFRVEGLHLGLAGETTGRAGNGCRFAFKKSGTTVVRTGLNYKF